MISRKDPALQDSPPAAGRICDTIPFRRSAILPEGFLLYRKLKNFLYTKKKPTPCRLLLFLKYHFVIIYQTQSALCHIFNELLCLGVFLVIFYLLRTVFFIF